MYGHKGQRSSRILCKALAEACNVDGYTRLMVYGGYREWVPHAVAMGGSVLREFGWSLQWRVSSSPRRGAAS